MSTLAGRYVLERRLGGGGMAEVFLGKLVGKDGFSRPVAIKRVLAHFATDEAFTKMFVAEAQMCSKLQHPNIVSVLDFDRDDDGRPFLVIELVDGPSLAELADAGALPIGAALHIASELLRGLAYAHDLPGGEGVRGIVHRDISPHNVLLSWEGAVKLSDFGIAKARAASGVTASEMVKGKPAYMSPEQANAENLDGRSDLFSVGIVLWELLCGRALFSGHTTQETLARVLFAPIPSPQSIRAEVPADVDRVVMKLLARKVDERYADASDVIAELVACKDSPRDGREQLVALLADRFADDAPQRVRMLADVPTVRTPAEYAPTLPAPRDARSRTRPIVLALAGVAIAFGAVAFTIIAVGRHESPPIERVSAPALVADATLAVAIDSSDVVMSSPPTDAAMEMVDAPMAKVPVDAAPKPQAAPPNDRAAARAKLLAETNNSGRLRFALPDRIDPSRMLVIARKEAERLLGKVQITGVHWQGIEADNTVDLSAPGAGVVAIAFHAPKPFEDGDFCVHFDSRPEGGVDEALIKNNPAYCGNRIAGTATPRCTAAELRTRAGELGLAKEAVFSAEWHVTRWQLISNDWRAFTPNDCH